MTKFYFHCPFPPSANNYWRVGHGRVHKTSTARLYQDQVKISHWNNRLHIEGEVAVSLEFCYPNRRRRDLDNLLKVLLDALTAAEVWGDDSQVKELHAKVNPKVHEYGGTVHVTIEELKQ